MKKYLFVSAIAALALNSCSSDDFTGNVPGSNPSDITPKEISFGGETGKISRADGTESDANKLSNKFVVYGSKTINNEKKTVFDHYNVEYKSLNNDNTNSWIYEGVTKNSLNTTATNQTIKFWDYSATQYDFVAFSFGSATQGTAEGEVQASTVNSNDFSYTLTGKASELIKCYIADKVTKSNSSTSQYNQKVQFSFRSLGTKVNVGLYETIPGYSVKDVKFYSSATETTASSEKPILFASSATIPANEVKHTAKITFDNTNKAQISYDTQTTKSRADGEESAEGGTEETQAKNATFLTFGDLANKVDKESNEEAGKQYIGRQDSKNATKPTEPVTVLPCTTVGNLTLKVDYTLVSIDGSGETIKVTGATATIKADYTKWNSNTSYTYIFKISDQTNGSTGGGTAGLYPITFDAVVTETGTSTDHEEELKDSNTSSSGTNSSSQTNNSEE